MPKDIFRHTAERPTPDARTTVRAHRDQTTRRVACVVNDLVCTIALPGGDGDIDQAGLFQHVALFLQVALNVGFGLSE